MNPQEKAKELMARMNGQIITKEIWEQASEYARNDLKRKALIVVDEILLIMPMYIGNLNKDWVYWNDVKQEINKL